MTNLTLSLLDEMMIQYCDCDTEWNDDEFDYCPECDRAFRNGMEETTPYRFEK